MGEPRDEFPWAARSAMIGATKRAGNRSRRGASMKDKVIVIDDDPGVREALGGLLESVGLEADLYGSAADFLAAGRPGGPACLILDVRLPGQGGLEFQRTLNGAGIRLPIIFITGHGDIPMSVQAMKGGAIEKRRSTSCGRAISPSRRASAR